MFTINDEIWAMGRPANKAIKEVVCTGYKLHHATIATGGQVSLGSKIIKVLDCQYKGCQSTSPVERSSPILVHSTVCLQN